MKDSEASTNCLDFVLCYFAEVGKDVEQGLFSDGKMPIPIWEPHLCVLNRDTKLLSHYRTQKVLNIYQINYGRHLCNVQFTMQAVTTVIKAVCDV